MTQSIGGVRFVGGSSGRYDDLLAAERRSWRRHTDLPDSHLPHADSPVVDRTRHAVLDLDEELRQRVLLVERRIANIALGRGIDDVTHLEALDGLVLRDRSAAVRAPKHGRHAPPVLVPPVVATLRRHSLPTPILAA